MQISSSLWGGCFNPMIPIYKAAPRGWDIRPLKTPSARSLIMGYIEAYDPDILIECTTRVPQYVRDLKLEIVPLHSIWGPLETPENDWTPKYGIGIFELLSKIFDEHFRRVEASPPKLMFPQIPRQHALFWTSFFGELPKRIGRMIEDGYKEALPIDRHRFSPDQFSDCLKGDVLFPRRISIYGLDTTPGRNSFDRVNIFFMDASKAIDVIDYWNLRALGRTVLPLAKQFSQGQSIRTAAQELILQTHRPYRHNVKMYNWTTFIRSRSTTMEEMEAYAKSLSIDDESTDKHYFSLQHWYPRVWDDWAREKDSANPDELSAEETENELSETATKISLKVLRPEFAREYGGHGTPRFANEISPRIYSSVQPLAQIFPPAGKEVMRSVGDLGIEKEWRIGRTGLIRLIRHESSRSWSIPLAQDVFFAWLKDSGFEPRLSPPGSLARQIFQQLDGWVRVLGDPELLKLFERINGGSPDGKKEVATEGNMLLPEVKQRLPNPNLHNTLIAREVFKIGIRIQCPNCFRNSWFALSELKDRLDCPRCLGAYRAIGNISSGQWAYKMAGPFSISGYADGAYCVLLSLSFFNELLRIETTPSFSFEAKSKDGNSCEADFGLFWRQSIFGQHASGIVLGECKTFGKFARKDYVRMNKLAKSFPGSIVSFCTLRKKLEQDEVREISKLAKRGRRKWKNDAPINPVLVLTGNELLGFEGPPYCWKDMGLKRSFERVYSLLDICNATQQIHLDLEPWEETRTRELQERRAGKS